MDLAEWLHGLRLVMGRYGAQRNIHVSRLVSLGSRGAAVTVVVIFSLSLCLFFGASRLDVTTCKGRPVSRTHVEPETGSRHFQHADRGEYIFSRGNLIIIVLFRLVK